MRNFDFGWIFSGRYNVDTFVPVHVVPEQQGPSIEVIGVRGVFEFGGRYGIR